MTNDKYIIVYDFESTGKDPRKVAITQIAGVILHPRTLDVVDKFNRDYIKPREGDLIEDEAFKVTRKDKERLLKDGYDPKLAWGEWANWIKQYNNKCSTFMAPIPAGYNIDGYDAILNERYCRDYGYIEKKSDKQYLISSFMSFDLMKFNFWLHESNPDLVDLKFDTYRDYVGLSKDNAHDALQDVEDTAAVVAKHIRWFREITKRAKFKDSFLR